MIKYLKLAIMFAVPQMLFAQKEMKSISYKRFEVPIEIMQYPSEPLGEEYQTYRLVMNLPQGINYVDVADKLTETLQIAGFQAVPSDGGDGDLLIKFNVYQFDFLRTDVISTSSTGEDCALQIFYSYNYRLELIDQKTKKVLSQYHKTTRKLGKDVEEMWSKGYRSKKDMEMDQSQIEKIKREILNKVLVEPCQQCASSWTTKYGKKIITFNMPMQRIYEKIYYETYFFLYQSYNLQQFFKANVRVKNPPAPSQKEIDEFVRYNQEVIAKEKNMALKGKNTIDAMCYCNIGWIYYACDDFDKACEYGEKALATGEMKTYANALIWSSNTAADILAKNGVSSRYLTD